MNYNCPICHFDKTKQLLSVDGFDIWRCIECTFDFVAPAPTEAEMKSFYNREEWFEGGERGGYASYDAQTEESPVWLLQLLEKIASERPTPSVLDIGCAYGTHLGKAQEMGWQCFGVEPSDHARQMAMERHSEIYITETIAEIPPHRFDLILILEVIEHLSDPYAMFYQMFTAGQIGPETIIAITTPNSRSHSAVADPGGWAFRHPPSHLTFYSAHAFQALMKRLGFAYISIEGQHLLSDCPPVSQYPDEDSSLNAEIAPYAGLKVVASGSDFAHFMQERFVPGTWSELTAYEHFPRYSFALQYAHGKRVLDFGCGTGYGSEQLAGVASSVLAVDIDEAALDYAQMLHRKNGLSFEKEENLCDGMAKDSFDLIVCFEVIEHLTEIDQSNLLRNFARILTPDGVLILSTPNPDVTKLYGDNPFHLKEMSRDEFSATIDANFQNKCILSQSLISGVTLTLVETAAPKSLTLNGLYPGGDNATVPAAWLALCSNAPILAPAQHIYLDDQRSYIEFRVEALNKRGTDLISLYEARKRAGEFEKALIALHERGGSGEASGSTVDQIKEHLDNLVEYRVKQIVADQSAEVLSDLKKETEPFFSGLLELKHQLKSIDQKWTSQHASFATIGHEVEFIKQWIVEERDKLHVSVSEKNERKYELEGELAKLQGEITASQHRLHQIETSIRWRALMRLSPFLFVARPVILTARRLRRLARSVRRLSGPRERKNAGEQADSAGGIGTLQGETHTIVSQKPRVDETLNLLDDPVGNPNGDLAAVGVTEPSSQDESPVGDKWETAREPVWNEALGHYDLVTDDNFLAAASESGSSIAGLIKPYTVRPRAIPSNPGALPCVLHIIPNVYVGGSTQLLIDIVEHLSGEYRHEIVTSALWPAGPHVGLKVHHVKWEDADRLEHLLTEISPDIVHVHYWGLSDDPWYWRVMDSLHSIPDAKVIENVNTPIEPIVHDRINRYVFVSEYVRQDFGSYVPRSMTSLVYPGIDLSKFSTRFSSVDAENAIGMVYRLEGDKLRPDAIDLFIEVVKRRPRTRVYIIGGGSFLTPYIARTIAAGVRSNFRFTGYVPYENLPAWYDRFSIFVAPVWKESFGQVTPFAMAKEIAIAGYRTGALPEIVGSEELFGTSLEETAGIIVDLLNDPSRRDREGVANKERAQLLFSVEAMVEKYRKLYRKLLHQGDG